MDIHYSKAKANWPIWLVTLAIFINGLVTILQILLIRFPQRSPLYNWLLPFGLYHWSRSLTVALGFLFIYLSFHLFQRHRVAWWVATIGSGIALLAHLGHPQLWPTAFAPAVTLALLLVFHKRFTVRSEPSSIVRGFIFMVLILLAAVIYGTVGFWLLDKRDFGITFSLTDALMRTLREFLLIGNTDLAIHTRYARWFLESLDVTGALAAGFAVYSLFRPVAHRLAVLPHERAIAKEILTRYGHSTYDYFKLWPDKSFFFSETLRSFIAYRAISGVALCLGDPTGPEEELEKLTVSFLHFCANNGWIVSFLVPDLSPMYRKLGLSTLKIGEEAIVNLERFNTQIANKKYFRYVRRKFEGAGYQLTRYKPPHLPALLDEIEDVSREWLTLPAHREFGFFQGHFQRSYIAETTLFVVREPLGRVVAFINEVPSYRPGEATFDMARHRPGEHWGIMDYLFTGLMPILHKEGYRTFNMGLAPLARVGEESGTTVLEKAVHQLYEHLNRYISFKGLRQYKLKFEPDWEERFMAYQGSTIGLLRIALTITRAL